MPVRAMPLMNCFWKMMNTIAEGIMMRAAAAMTADRSVWCWVEKKLRASGRVILSALDR